MCSRWREEGSVGQVNDRQQKPDIWQFAFAAKDTVWLRQLLHELERHYIDPDERSALPATVLYGDNTGSNGLTRNPEHRQ